MIKYYTFGELMNFSEQLNSYIDKLGATHKELAEASGLSAATISRYCSGEREPGAGSRQLTQLADGLAVLASARDESGMDSKTVLSALTSSLSDSIVIDYDAFVSNLNLLMKSLDIRASELARGIYSDPSYVSKILSGSRKPGNVSAFVNEVSTYITNRFSDSGSLSSLVQIIDPDGPSSLSPSEARNALAGWLGSGVRSKRDDPIPKFLNSVDSFDLGEYLTSVHFDELKVPPSMPQLPTRKVYSGIQKMMESELDFMKTTVLSRSMDDVTVYSDMPMEEMAADTEFPKKYLFGLAMMLKKGLRINFIHDINRPFNEMMMGLEGYIPMYMTGQISPYYLPSPNSGVFNHLLKVSGAAALEGSAINGSHGEGRYVLYRSKEDVAHYRQRAEQLLAKAKPLMDIFDESRCSGYRAALDRILTNKDVRFICSNLPLYFLSRSSFEEMIDDLGLTAEQANKLRRYYDRARSRLLSHMSESTVRLILPDISGEEYAKTPLRLSFADLFMNIDYKVPYDTFHRYRAELMQLADEYPGFIFDPVPSPLFSNINITIAGDKMVIVSKEKSPTIHFVIYHSRMIRAFQDFIPFEIPK